MKTLASFRSGYDLLEVTEDGRINKITFLGRLYYVLLSFFHIRKGFQDCKLELVAERLDKIISVHLATFASLKFESQEAILEIVKNLETKSRNKTNPAETCFHKIIENLQTLLPAPRSHYVREITDIELKDEVCGVCAQAREINLKQISFNLRQRALETSVIIGDKKASEAIAVSLVDEPETWKRRAVQQLLLIVGLVSNNQNIIRHLKKKGFNPLISESYDFMRFGGQGLGSVTDIIKNRHLGTYFQGVVNEYLNYLIEQKFISFRQQTNLREMCRDAFERHAFALATKIFLLLSDKDKFVICSSLLPLNTLDVNEACKEHIYKAMVMAGPDSCGNVLGFFEKEKTSDRSWSSIIESLRVGLHGAREP